MVVVDGRDICNRAVSCCQCSSTTGRVVIEDASEMYGVFNSSKADEATIKTSSVNASDSSVCAARVAERDFISNWVDFAVDI